MTQITIRPFHPDDGQALADIDSAAVASIDAAYYDAATLAQWAARKRPESYAAYVAQGFAHLVAEIGARAVGFVAFGADQNGDGRIPALFVEPSSQGHDIGTRLLEQAETVLFEEGKRRITVDATLNARGFYASRGYVETGPVAADIGGGLSLALRQMEKHRTALRPDGTPWRNFYGRRHGKKLRPAQQRDMDGALVEIQPQGVTRADNPTRMPIDLLALFGRDAPTWLEIGFGAGEHMFHQAGLNPDVGIIGCEPYINGVAQFMSKMRDAGLSNVRVHPGDARDLLEVLPEASLDKLFLLYPDPWPKTRHHRRRFVVPENLTAVARALKPGGIFRVATDIPDYVRQTLEVTLPMPEFEWLAEGPRDWREPWSDWTRTRYEAKAIREDRVPHYLTFRRI